MIQYILECVAFQLVFLIIYDFFLKRETFFQWNRAYLIGTYILSLLLPWIKIEAFKTAVPKGFYVYPEYLWGTNDALVVVAKNSSGLSISWEQGLLFGGMLLAALLFGFKMLQIYRLRRKGEIQFFKDFTRIVISNSHVAFSFFKSIFLGDRIMEKEHDNIIEHELVHIRQRHTYDLLFFELMRIVGWFNPLVYVYQNRISELHEFIADAQVAKSDKAEQYELLLSQVFQTKNISFINQFFNSSLIKKRIVMLTKERSKTVYRLKYVLLLPLVLGMLIYTSCQRDLEITEEQGYSVLASDDDKVLIRETQTKIDQEVEKLGSIKNVFRNFSKKQAKYTDNHIMTKEDYFERAIISKRHFTTYMDSLKKAKTPFFRAESLSKLPLPSTSSYESFVKYTRTFQMLDNNLTVSIDYKNRAIRPIEKEDKNLGPGEWVVVQNISDLTGDEVRKVNHALQSVEGTDRMVAITDGNYSFLIYRVFEGTYPI